MKKLLISAGVLAVALTITLLIFLTNLSLIVERTIERFGTRMTGTEVAVASVSIQPRERRATLTGMTIANPIGYTPGPALSFGEIIAAVDVEAGVVDKVIVSAPEVRVEVKGGSSNIQELAEHVADYQPLEDRDGSSGEERRIAIKLFEVESARATMVTDFSEKTYEFKVDRMRFEDLEGTREQVTQQVLRQLTRQIAREVATEILKERARDKASELGDKLKDMLDGDD